MSAGHTPAENSPSSDAYQEYETPKVRRELELESKHINDESRRFRRDQSETGASEPPRPSDDPRRARTQREHYSNTGNEDRFNRSQRNQEFYDRQRFHPGSSRPDDPRRDRSWEGDYPDSRMDADHEYNGSERRYGRESMYPTVTRDGAHFYPPSRDGSQAQLYDASSRARSQPRLNSYSKGDPRLSKSKGWSRSESGIWAAETSIMLVENWQIIANYIATIVALVLFLVLGVYIGHHWGPEALQDYQNALASQAAVHVYTLTISEGTISPDGYSRSALLINGAYPGPTLTANLGETFQITVVNKLGVPTSFHWHGMLQQNTSFMDGVPGVTQCAIQPGQSFTYTFTAYPAGTFWYHSHYEMQYGDGLLGALVIYDPNVPFNYTDERSLLLTDWYHTPVTDLVVDFLSVKSGGNEPVPDIGLINGKGVFDCTVYSDALSCSQYDSADLYSDTWIAGQTYFLRIIGASTFATFFFSIDGISLTVVEVDGIYVNPVNTSTVSVNPGQRVGVLASSQSTGDYWIRSTMDTTMFTYNNSLLNPETLGILRVVSSDSGKADSTDPHTTSTMVMSDASDDNYSPLYSSVVLDADVSITIQFSFVSSTNGLNLPVIYNNTYVNDLSSTSIVQEVAAVPFQKFDSPLNIIRIPGGRIIEIVLINDDAGDHPFHLHGHQFWVLARGTGSYNSSVSLQTNNPLMRDTVRVPASGFAVLRFVADNPGVWVFHCHIEWHMMAGLAVVFVEDAQAVSLLQIPDANAALCSSSQ